MKLYFYNLGTFEVLKPSVLFLREVNVVIDKCTSCFTSKLKFVFKPARLLCSFVICEFPLMDDCLMCTFCPGKIWHLVSDVPLFTISQMNDLRSEFNSRNHLMTLRVLKLLQSTALSSTVDEVFI